MCERYRTNQHPYDNNCLWPLKKMCTLAGLSVHIPHSFLVCSMGRVYLNLGCSAFVIETQNNQSLTVNHCPGYGFTFDLVVVFNNLTSPKVLTLCFYLITI